MFNTFVKSAHSNGLSPYGNQRRGQGRLVAFALVFAGLSSIAYGSEAEKPTYVTTKPLKDLIIHPARDAPATTVSLNDTRVASEIRGIVQKIFVQVGDRLSKGDEIAQLDCENHEIAAEQAMAAFQAAEAKHGLSTTQLENAKKLSKTRNISEEEFDKREADARTAKAEKDRLQASLKTAQLTARKCTVRSPFGAVVIKKIASIGDYLVPGATIVRILDEENIEVSANVQEQDLEDLRRVDRVEYISRQQTYPLQVRTILPLMESRIRSYEVRLSFIQKKASPGSTGRIRWTISEGYIPPEFLVKRDNTLGIFVERNGKASFAALENAQFGQPAHLHSSMSPDVKVIVDGRFSLKDGEILRIMGSR